MINWKPYWPVLGRSPSLGQPKTDEELIEEWKICCRGLKGIQEHIESLEAVLKSHGLKPPYTIQFGTTPKPWREMLAYGRATRVKENLERECNRLEGILETRGYSVSYEDCEAAAEPSIPISPMTAIPSVTVPDRPVHIPPLVPGIPGIPIAPAVPTPTRPRAPAVPTQPWRPTRPTWPPTRPPKPAIIEHYEEYAPRRPEEEPITILPESPIVALRGALGQPEAEPEKEPGISLGTIVILAVLSAAALFVVWEIQDPGQ